MSSVNSNNNNGNNNPLDLADQTAARIRQQNAATHNAQPTQVTPITATSQVTPTSTQSTDSYAAVIRATTKSTATLGAAPVPSDATVAATSPEAAAAASAMSILGKSASSGGLARMAMLVQVMGAQSQSANEQAINQSQAESLQQQMADAERQAALQTAMSAILQEAQSGNSDDRQKLMTQLTTQFGIPPFEAFGLMNELARGGAIADVLALAIAAGSSKTGAQATAFGQTLVVDAGNMEAGSLGNNGWGYLFNSSQSRNDIGDAAAAADLLHASADNVDPNNGSVITSDSPFGGQREGQLGYGNGINEGFGYKSSQSIYGYNGAGDTNDAANASATTAAPADPVTAQTEQDELSILTRVLRDQNNTGATLQQQISAQNAQQDLQGEMQALMKQLHALGTQDAQKAMLVAALGAAAGIHVVQQGAAALTNTPKKVGSGTPIQG